LTSQPPRIVLNYEEGGENCVLHGDAASEAFLSDIAGAAMWPGQRHWNMESIYEYGARAGFWRLHRLFTGMDIPSRSTAWPPRLPAPRTGRGHEGCGLGDRVARPQMGRSPRHAPEGREPPIAEAIRLHTEVVGENALCGWYTGRCSE
jgi:hypothetical protein